MTSIPGRASARFPMNLRLLPLFCLAVATIHAADESTLVALRAADDARVSATISADRARLTDIFSNDLRYAHSTGVVDTKMMLMDAITSGRTKYESIVYDERVFDVAKPGIALMTGRARVKVSTSDGRVENSLSFLAVWCEEGGRWRFRAWQSCRIPITGSEATIPPGSRAKVGTGGTASSVPALLPGGWNPKAEADKRLEGMIQVTGPEVKGAHDADLVMVGDRAFVVATANDVKPGHGAKEAEYCTMSIVNLRSLRVEQRILIAKSEQVFANQVLPIGACFVPRILQLNNTTLRCFFACEDQSGRGQAQTWYRDFDVPSLAFSPEIYRMKIKTASGIFDLEPKAFHADAVAHGFRQKFVGFGLYLIDSFKAIDGRTYAVINNWPGAQNALAVLNDARDTLEILGHYNEPAELRLTESSVNRLPDGSWLAICRAESGDRNYVFTTSKDGKTWTRGEPRPFVTKGSNSKPTFDKFNGAYYLGWQEATRVTNGYGVGRNFFNIEVSRDGVKWERKYRFESTKSFQYPTFRLHNGSIWFTVTQGTGGSTDRIMFGKLENLSALE
jgi:hypothetical protein